MESVLAPEEHSERDKSPANRTLPWGETVQKIMLAQPLNELNKLTLTILPRHESKPKPSD